MNRTSKCRASKTTQSAICCAALLLMLFVAASARAQVPTFDHVSGGFLDQEFVEDFSDPRYASARSYSGLSGYLQTAQSFVAGSDAILSHIMIRVGATWGTPVTVSILDFYDSLPGDVLASRTLIPGNPISRTWATFDLRNHELRLNAGESYAIAIEVPPTGGGHAYWESSLWGNPVRTYDPGRIFHRLTGPLDGQPLPHGGNWNPIVDWPYSENDLLFRVYVNPVPEPSAVALIVAGSLAIGIRRRR